MKWHCVGWGRDTCERASGSGEVALGGNGVKCAVVGRLQ